MCVVGSKSLSDTSTYCELALSLNLVFTIFGTYPFEPVQFRSLDESVSQLPQSSRCLHLHILGRSQSSTVFAVRNCALLLLVEFRVTISSTNTTISFQITKLSSMDLGRNWL